MARDAEGAAAALESLGGYQQGLYAEKWVPYVKVRYKMGFGRRLRGKRSCAAALSAGRLLARAAQESKLQSGMVAQRVQG